MTTKKIKVAVLGATGYVGGRLVDKLLEADFCVVACGRSLKKLQTRQWAHSENVSLAEANVLDEFSLCQALKNVDVAFYLVHSMEKSVKDYSKEDHAAAICFWKACEKAGVRQIIYLGGLGSDEDDLSQHLKSRRDVENTLKDGSVPVTVLRAAMIIGSGSASFEILRYLVDRLPVMVTPRWVKTPCQPIAIANVLHYLVGCADNKKTFGKTFDIGGAEILNYESLMKIYAEEAGLPKRWVIPVPVLTPRLSSYWIHLVTPVPAYIAKPLAEGLKNPVICKNTSIQDLIPQKLLSPREAIRRALQKLDQGTVDTSWTDAGKMPPVEWAMEHDPSWAGGTLFVDRRSIPVYSDAEQLWAVVEGIGGKNGWYHANFLWLLRGLLDRLMGGVGLRRGRRDAKHLKIGDSLDFWRVAQLEPGKHLTLVAEMKLPGRAILEFHLDTKKIDQTILTQVATFSPKGLFGILYWYAVAPFHNYVFSGMLKKIKLKSEREEKSKK